ncbi:Ldh family oxidoreductase [Desulfoscipio geothermicus]|uniref:Malate/lactate/ureidoglycolate dehydrogenase, LDH2 family n=1 Tax=Desulfoscipio geothermicus DSM 3669 TaxID=1121426 RepID=A0A1I6DZ34_9FIRM|nr:Ldh family oxidoreductase [Desulfoscipio geothermicus]SFR10657.1 Malate/lactate/ureidoglycolate dehydrogenase, LDH2 family [Desulfoscipio geothermicus DSM 3669]
MKHYPAADLKKICVDVLKGYGVPEENADITASVMISASLRGIDSHGIAYLPVYVERIKRGVVDPKAQPEIVTETANTAVVDCKNGLGQVGGVFAMNLAVKKALASNTGFVGLRNSGHFGMVSYYTMQAAKNNCIGLAMTNAPSSVAPFGGMEPLFGTNPISFAFPVKDRPDIVIDFATSAIARTKLRNMAAEKQEIPEGWALSKEGYMAKTADEGYEGVLLPAAGVKGYGLAIIAEVLSAVLTGAAFTTRVGGLVDDFSRSQNVGHFLGAISIESFLPMDQYYDMMDQFIGTIKGVKPVPGVQEVLYPGELEFQKETLRKAEGIPVDDAMWEKIKKCMEELNK